MGHSEHYLLACYRYIELNPVAAALVQHPSEYPWSIYYYNAYGKSNTLLTPHQLYKALGMTMEEQQKHHRNLFKVPLDLEDESAIRTAACFSIRLGGSRFSKQIEKGLGRRIGHSKRGRPYDQPRTQDDSDED